MPRGTCRLCRKERELKDSHLIPKAYYRLMRMRGAKNPNPVVVSPGVAYQTSRQVMDYLLCDECEGRFNKRGEDWVLWNAWRGENRVLILDALSAAQPAGAGPNGFRAFKGSEIAGLDVQKLIYYGTSVFWRAALHDWRQR